MAEARNWLTLSEARTVAGCGFPLIRRLVTEGKIKANRVHRPPTYQEYEYQITESEANIKRIVDSNRKNQKRVTPVRPPIPPPPPRPEPVQSLVEMLQQEHPLNTLSRRVHKANARWWVHLDTGAPLERNVGELLMLVVSELAEAMEGHRRGLQDDKLPLRKMFEVELADAVIRILDICGGLNLDLGGAFEEKMACNALREDHKREARLKDGGKKY